MPHLTLKLKCNEKKLKKTQKQYINKSKIKNRKKITQKQGKYVD
jgi:hypothetical protein